MKIAFSFLLATLLIIVTEANAQKNLVVNGGFEDGLNNWASGNAKVSTFIRNSGENSLALVSFVKGKWEGIDQRVKLPKSTKAIVLAGFSKADGVEAGDNNWNTAVVLVEFTNGDQKIGEGTVLVQKTGSENWSPFKKALKVPEHATGFRLIVALSEASGTFFVDDLSAKAIPIEEMEKVNP